MKGIVRANCHGYGPAWRGVAWRGVAWRGVAWRGAVAGSETRSANPLKAPESHFWPPSAPGQRCCPVVEPHSARAAADAPAGLRRTPAGFGLTLGSDG
ncbi:TPA: hypothetical protein NU590_004390 [Enterobacter hormaechei subsp. xiangfangensis]|uniref:hypothetical protein n=1 Tax=Enterobacter hormaechei TaxID=158836 RepID=UPI0007B34610|nr:hypothetical protein [Enterobacter hormaechei]HCJ6305997.1 hypothetical protein [Enterobacter hormaechei subsp. xiangfangensis]KZP96071.1 hypothetical protein A3N35_10085 [Enterobacter hormaechei subsp. steigerwaltii]TYF49153.1 hypothetical protein DJ546_15985 [Enterobacter hormaechei]TYF69468.1 hypothetical protein DJ539_23175 [Enterobacter hormaechei]HCT8091817.1 hypothetical protein [Enterobacter hormaechei]